MNACITVREFARLTTVPVATPSLDCAQVSVSAFEWLCKLNARIRSQGAPFAELEDSRWLRLDNFVGVVETPCGTRLEILPKHLEADDCICDSRALRQRMIASAMDITPRAAGEASLQLFNAPLSEWVITQFLATLDHLIKRGVRSDYLRVESAERFLRGQLNLVRQMRQPPGRDYVLNIRHDIFLPDRAENRLLKLALDRVAKIAQSPSNWRLAQELRSLLSEIPASRDVADDFREWRKNRLMAHYQPVKPWCELILYQQMPYALQGHWHGISMLFPMEKLFEHFVEKALRADLLPGAKLIAQAASHSLCKHDGGDIFQLRPDMLLKHGLQMWVLDAKWKRLDASDRAHKYGLSQADLYQVFAYGQKYLGGKGEMALIYPKSRGFSAPLEPFDYGNGLRLWVLPFDLDEMPGGRLQLAEKITLPLLSKPLQPSAIDEVPERMTAIG